MCCQILPSGVSKKNYISTTQHNIDHNSENSSIVVITNIYHGAVSLKNTLLIIKNISINCP